MVRHVLVAGLNKKFESAQMAEGETVLASPAGCTKLGGFSERDAVLQGWGSLQPFTVTPSKQCSTQSMPW